MDPFKNNKKSIQSMSEQDKTNEWDSLWQEYTKSLENWKSLFEQIQNASNDMQTKFNQVWEKASTESSPETIKDFTENWQKSMTDVNTSAFKQFADNWQKALSSSGLEQMNAYGEMMKKFAETWNIMWPKSQ
jgi:uncharacterized protein with von Willebrand factor type A (vWA) domain